MVENVLPALIIYQYKYQTPFWQIRSQLLDE